MVHIDDLPADLLILIASYLEPLELLLIRSTCKALSGASRDRVLWSQILERVCAAHDVVQGTFLPGEMNQEEIEAAALKPYRFSQALWRHNSETDVFSFHRQTTLTFTCEDDSAEANERNITDYHLASGGRYLVLIRARRWLELWDLEGGGGSNLDLLPHSIIKIAALKLPSVVHILRSIDPWVKPGGSGRLQICLRLRDDASNELNCVYEINPCSSTAPIALRSRCPEPSRPWNCCSGDIYIAVQDHDERIFIWDLTTGQTRLYPIDTSKCQIDISSGMLVGDYVCFVGYPEVLAWRISTLDPNIVNVPRQLATFPGRGPSGTILPWCDIRPHCGGDALLDMTIQGPIHRASGKENLKTIMTDMFVLQELVSFDNTATFKTHHLGTYVRETDKTDIIVQMLPPNLSGNYSLQQTWIFDRSGAERNTLIMSPVWRSDQEYKLEVRRVTTWIDTSEALTEDLRFDAFTGRHIFFEPESNKFLVVDMIPK